MTTLISRDGAEVNQSTQCFILLLALSVSPLTLQTSAGDRIAFTVPESILAVDQRPDHPPQPRG